MDRIEKLALWHQISGAKFLGPVRFKRLWQELGEDIGRVFSMSDKELLAIKGAVTSQNLKGIRGQANQAEASREFMKKQVDLCDRARGRILTLDDPDYPKFLRDSKMCHAIIYTIGDISRFTRYEKALAVVGTREPTPESADLACRVSKVMAERGWVLVSGLAKGIDSCCHQGALDGGGQTIAVMGCGPDVLYPPKSGELYERIKAQGLVLSEFPFGTRPEDWKLKKRNKTTVALSLTAFIVQTSAKGGTMNAARSCKEQGKRPCVLLPSWHCDKAGNTQAIEDGGVPIVPGQDIPSVLQTHLTAKEGDANDLGCLLGQDGLAVTARELDVRGRAGQFSVGGNDFKIRIFLLCEEPAVYRVIGEKLDSDGLSIARIHEKGHVSEHAHSFVENEDMIAGWIADVRAEIIVKAEKKSSKRRS